MKDTILGLHAFNLVYAQKIVADIPDERLAEQPVPGRVMNHAAFLLGHLAWANDNGVRVTGRPAQLPVRWKELFAMGNQPQGDRSLYPPKAELLAALEGAHARLAEAFLSAPDELLAQPGPERLRVRFPTNGHLLIGLLTSHAASHNGQMSAWRRAMGWPSVF